ncbi:interferon lambda-2-like [Ctenodactylus gundi]
MTPDSAGGGLLVLVLMAIVLSSTGAVPVPGPLGLLSDAKDCHMAQFKAVSPQAMQAFKQAKDALEAWLLLQDSRCSSRLFPRAWDLRQLQVWERREALQAELALTLKVLGTLTHSTLADVLDQPLHTLHHVHSQLQACASTQPTAAPRPRSRRLSAWLKRLLEASRKESPGCLQASVTSHLFRLLTRDLRCVAGGDPCA